MTTPPTATPELTTDQVQAWQQSRIANVQAEITAVLTKHGCKLDAVPVLLSDGRISAQLLVSCI